MTNASGEWFYVENGQKAGPVSAAELRKLASGGRVQPGTLLWKPGLPNWVEARRVGGLFPAAVAAPPPVPAPPMPGPLQPRGSIAGAPQTSAVPTQTMASDQKDETIALIAVLAPLGAATLMWFWVGGMNLLQGPQSYLNLLIFGTLFVVSILIAIDAGKLGIGGPNDLDKRGRRRKNGPVQWAIFTLFLFVGGFPSYMAIRSRYGARNNLILAIISMSVFIVVLLFVQGSIEMRASRVRDGLETLQRQFNGMR